MNDTFTIPEDSVLSGTVATNDTDIDSSPLSFSIISGVTNGIIVFNSNGSFTYTPAANYNGTDSFTYQVCDNGTPDLCDTATAWIIITPVNDAPVANDDYYTVSEGSTLSDSVGLNDTDVEGDTLAFSLVQDVSHGLLIINSEGAIQYTPDLYFSGLDSFVYAACDNGSPNLCDTAVVYITVTHVNHPPVAIGETVSLCSGDSVTIPVLANDMDPDGDSMTVTLTSIPLYGTATVLPDNSVYYIANPAISGVDTISYIVCDNYTTPACSPASGVITIYRRPDISFTTVNPSCAGNSNGTISSTVTGGALPLFYLWNTSAITPGLSALSAGIYTLTVLDAVGCSLSDSVTLTDPLLITLSSTHVDVLCKSDSTGSIDLSVNGGIPPYSFAWNTGDTTEDISTLPAGMYSVVVQDSNGCSNSDSVLINQPAFPISLTGTPGNTTASGFLNGTIITIASGGAIPYNYMWSNGSTTNNLNHLAPGTYSVTVTDGNGCSASRIFVVPLSDTLAITGVVSNVNCNGSLTGAIDITATGGYPPYTYSWNTGSTAEDISSTGPGIYTVTVTDSSGDTISGTYTITEPTLLSGTVTSVKDVTCHGGNDGSVDVTISGGILPYSFSWNTGDTTEDLVNIPAGNDALNVTDLNGCAVMLVAVVKEPPAGLAITVNLVTDVLCHGNSTGAIDISAGGGTPPYIFSWSNGATTEDLSGITSGNYTVTVSDSGGCGNILSVSVNQPSAALNATINTIQDVSCFGGTNGAIDISVIGGTSPYSFTWSNGSTTQDLSGLLTNSYNVSITDSVGCTSLLTAFVAQPPAPLNITVLNITDAKCFNSSDGAIDVNITGGTPSYSFNWSNGGTTEDLAAITSGNYTLTVTDAKGCVNSNSFQVQQPIQSLDLTGTEINPVSCYGQSNGGIYPVTSGGTSPYSYTWSSGQTTDTISDLSSGTYNLTVNDAHNCTLTQSFSVPQPPSGIQLTPTVVDVICTSNVNGAIYLSVSGGTSPYTYQWSNGAVTRNLTGISPGTYSVIVSDSLGCSINQSIAVNELTIITTLAMGPTTFCIGGNVTLQSPVFNGATYQWESDSSAMQGETNPNLLVNQSGNYRVVLTLPCGSFSSSAISVLVNPLPVVRATGGQFICRKTTAKLVATGGDNYVWSPAYGLSNSLISNPVAKPETSTVYRVMATDINECTASDSVKVDVCDPLLIPSGFSPNEDGVNDTYEIVGIDNYPGNSLHIYNRWGNLVYQKDDYDNSWDGRSNVSSFKFGDKLPDGTYYYVLDLDDGEGARTGYIILRR